MTYLSTQNQRIRWSGSFDEFIISICQFINDQIKKKLLLLCSGSNLDKKDLFSESDPFFTVSRINPDDSYTVVYRSDYIKDEPAPSWPPVTITSDKLCNGDWNRRLKVEIFDYNDRYLQSGPSSVSYLDLLVAVLIYVYVSQNLLENWVSKQSFFVLILTTAKKNFF